MKEKLKRYAAHIIVSCCLLALLGFFAVSCMPPATYMRMPESMITYKFTGFDIPETKPPYSVPFTIAVVEPQYKEQIHPFYSRVIKSFSNSVGMGLDQTIVAKGMTSKGPYGSLDEVPYPDKTSSNLTLTETVYIQPVEREDTNAVDQYYTGKNGETVLCAVKSGKLTVDIWISFEMREPLSAEKMWIKKLELGTLERKYQIGVQKYWVQTSSDPWAGNQGEWRYGEVMFNTKADALAGIVNEVYPKIMNSAWVYLNTDELTRLDDKVKEIRTRLSAPLR